MRRLSVRTLGEPLRSAALFSSPLDKNVENKAALIHGAPKPVRLSGDGNDDFIQMPSVAAHAPSKVSRG